MINEDRNMSTAEAERIDILSEDLTGTNQYMRIEPKNKTYDVEEGLKARVKDPLWLLGRQWQVGEFKAENGGRPVRTEITYKKLPINKIVRGNSESKFELNDPLEMVVEKEPEDISKVVDGWNPQHLEYSFKIKNGKTELIADEYDGNQLDWYNFKISNNVKIDGAEEHVSMLPNNLSYRGMPDPRWWAFEDQNVDLGNIKRPYLNYLTMILTKFALEHSNDWFYLPIDHEIGYIRKITKFNIIDSFGIAIEASPVVDPSKTSKGWEVFTLSNQQEGGVSDGSLFYIPNNLDDGGLESEPIEEVSLLRDELANLVWGIEHKYENADGTIVDRHDEEIEEIQKKREEGAEEEPIAHYWDVIDKVLVKEENIPEESELGTRYIGPLAKYEMMSYILPYWIPYVSRQIVTSSGTLKNGQMILRRGRTNMDSKVKQYKGTFLNESQYIFEEEVPRAGILLKRTWQNRPRCRWKLLHLAWQKKDQGHETQVERIAV